MGKFLRLVPVVLIAAFQSGALHGQGNLLLKFNPSGDLFNQLLKEGMQADSATAQMFTAAGMLQEWKNWQVVENFTYGKDRGALTMITDLNALHPYFRDRIVELIRICKSKGIELAVVESFRTHAKQNEYKGMGRKYTNSGGGKSKHQYGLAVDVVPIVNGKAVWDNVVLWRRIGMVGERLGLRWGGRWKHPYDPGHFEWTGGLSSVHLAAGMLPRVPADKYPCLEEDMSTLREYWKEWETFQSATTRK